MADAFEFFTNYVVMFLVVLTVLVFVHEMGHYLVARYNGVRVETFSIGFGTEIYGWTDKLGTRWKFGAVPLGGYVKMFGEYDGEDDQHDAVSLTPEEKAVSFHYKRVGQRTAIVAAGPLANFAFAIVVLALLFSIVGDPAPLAAVGQVSAGSAAEKAGLAEGDRFISIDGEAVKWFEDLRRIVSANPEISLSVVVLRGGSETTLTAIPERVVLEDGSGREIGRLGVRPDPAQIDYERQNAFVALGLAVERTAALTMNILSYVGEMIVGKRSADDLGGPLRIAKISGDMAKGGAINLVLFMAALSINLGLINLFPIPMLDGGHLVFYAAEVVRGRPVDKRVQEYGFRFGLILVVMLFVFVTFNDLKFMKVFEFIKEFVT